MIMTFITLTSTMDTSMTLMNRVMRSIILAMLANGESFSQVWISESRLALLIRQRAQGRLEVGQHLAPVSSGPSVEPRSR